MKIMRALHMRIYPDKTQQRKIDKTLAACRFIYNHMLYRQSIIYKRRKEHMSYYDMQNLLPAMKEYLPWLRETDSQALKYACRQVHLAFKNFFKKNADYPNFKKKKSYSQSYTTTNADSIHYKPYLVKLPCLGEMKCSDNRILNGKICYATITKKHNKYYLSITYSFEKEIIVQPINENQVIGIDYKSNGLYVDSNGHTVNMPHFFRESENKLAKEQQKLSRKKGARKGEKKSKRWLKQHLKVCKLQEHIANQRKDFLHKEALYLAKTYDAVCIEDLDMQAMSNSGFGNGKATLDNGNGMFRIWLQYKLEERGKQLVKIDKWFPSSQLCHVCGCKNSQTKDLNIRKWVCPDCGTLHDRDINAAINIKNEGLRLLMS